MDNKRLQELAGIITESRGGAEDWYRNVLRSAIMKAVHLGMKNPDQVMAGDIEKIIDEAMAEFDEGY